MQINDLIANVHFFLKKNKILSADIDRLNLIVE
jgi:hypothetical protein